MSDKYTTHEALDRASMFAQLVDAYLIENEAVSENAQWLALALQAHECLYKLYQAIGEKHL